MVLTYLKRVLYTLIISLLFIPNVFAKENIVNIYLFHSDSCIHCEHEIKLLSELEKKYTNIKVYKYEVSDKENSILFGEVSNLLDARVGGVPFTVIGNKYYSGYSKTNTKKVFMATIEYYSKYGYDDIVGKHIGNIEISNNIENASVTLEDYIDNYETYNIDTSLIRKINTKDMDISFISLILVLIDNVSICSIFLLLFLLIIIINYKDIKKIFKIGITFLLMLSFVNLIGMLLCFNISLNNAFWLRILFCIFILMFGVYNILLSIGKKELININNKLLVIVVIFLALFVGLIKLTYFFEIPKLFNEIIYLNNLSNLFKIFYIIIYNVFYLLSNLILFTIILMLIKKFEINDKYQKIIKIISSIILILFAVLLIF